MNQLSSRKSPAVRVAARAAVQQRLQAVATGAIFAFIAAITFGAL